MSSRDQATAAFLGHLATIGDGAFIGLGLAFFAATSWIKYLSSAAALRRIRDAPSPRISDLRALISPNPNLNIDVDGEGGGKLVVVRGRAQPKPSFERNGGALVSQGSGERAVIVQQAQTCIYNERIGILGWRFDLHAILAKSWNEKRSSSVRSVPFILVEGGHWPNSGYVHVSLDGSTHPLPLTTVYHQLHPVQATAYTFLQVIFGNGYPVAILDEEKILPVGKEVTAVGICRTSEGSLEIKSCPELPCFLSDKTKDQIEIDLSLDTRILFWSGVVLGTMSIGILGYAIVRNLWRWKEWRERERERQRQRQRQAQELRNEGQAQNNNDEESGDVPDGQLCVVCLTRQRRSAFVPCGHLVCCPGCAISVECESSPKCPVCRQSIRSSIRIYDS